MKTRINNSRRAPWGMTEWLLVAFVLLIPWRAMAVGHWTTLTHTAPGNVEMMLLLPDGTVMAQNAGGNAWYRLTPDIHGSYVNGAWTNRASMNNTRLYYASAVLPNGNVFVAGAEYGNGWATAELYDAQADSWTNIPVPAGLINLNNNPPASGQSTAGFSDSICKLLPNGNVLIAPVYPATNSGTLIFNPATKTITAGPPYLRSQNEASWVKLPDNSILTLDKQTTQSERFIPALNTWINDANVPVALYDAFAELGAGFLLPNGKAFFMGGTGSTVLYTPSGNTNPGTFAAGANLPAGLAAPDAAAAMMVNGKILCALSPPLYQTNVNGTTSTVFPSPTSFYEYDYTVGTTGSFTSVTGPAGATDNIPAYKTIMLDLPDGTVLYSDYTSQLYVYTPDLAPLAAGKPGINSISVNIDASYHLTGTTLNGISEGAAYGDDAQMDSNYPLVRLTDGNGNVYYATTYNWSSTSVVTGNTHVTTEFKLPGPVLLGGPAAYSLVVAANGIGSDPVAFTGPTWVDFNYSGFFQFGSFSNPYNTLAQGVASIPPGGTIFIRTAGATSETPRLSKAMTIIALGGPATIGSIH